MRKWLGFSLRRKLSFLMLLFALIPMLFLGLFAYGISGHLTRQNARQSGLDTLRQMQGSLSAVIKDVEGMSIYLIGQRDVQQYMQAQQEDQEMLSSVIGNISNLARSKSYISNIALYADHFGSLISSNTVYNTDFETPINVRGIHEKEWGGLYRVEDYGGGRNVITFIRPLRSIYNYQEVLGWLSISLDEEKVSAMWSNLQFSGGQGEIMLVGSDGSILSSTDKSRLFQSFDELYPGERGEFRNLSHGETTYTNKEGEGTSLMYYREPSVNWTLVGSIPTSWYGEQSRYILLLTAAAIVLAIVLSAGLTLFVLRRVTRPLELLTRLLLLVDPDRPMPVFHSGSGDEIARLGGSYNRLGEHIRRLKEQVILNETRKKEADMKALQAQINPHFLYNTLSSVHWMALMSKEQQIADMVGALSDFLRFSLNRGRDFCPVHQELAHIRNYGQVQSIRYPGRFELDFVINAELQEQLMLKLLLQPLVENSMVHGILKREEPGRITVVVERQLNLMSFMVIDDGVGMSRERLELLRASLLQDGEQISDTEGGYGLRNVNERLVLHYGIEFALEIDSRPGAGTRIGFSIPLSDAQYRNPGS